MVGHRFCFDFRYPQKLDMPSVDSVAFDRLRQSTAMVDDVWFLSGALQPQDSLKHLPIDEPEFVVGRKTGNSMRLQFNTVSGQHAKLMIKSGRLYLKDLGSTNGTYVNGERVTGRSAGERRGFDSLCRSPL